MLIRPWCGVAGFGRRSSAASCTGVPFLAAAFLRSPRAVRRRSRASCVAAAGSAAADGAAAARRPGPADGGSCARIAAAGVGAATRRPPWPGRCGGRRSGWGRRPVERALHLVLEAGGEAAEVAHRLADLAGRLGQALRAQHDQGEQQDDEELATPDVEHRRRVYRWPRGLRRGAGPASGSTGMCGGAAARTSADGTLDLGRGAAAPR